MIILTIAIVIWISFFIATILKLKIPHGLEFYLVTCYIIFQQYKHLTKNLSFAQGFLVGVIFSFVGIKLSDGQGFSWVKKK